MRGYYWGAHPGSQTGGALYGGGGTNGGGPRRTLRLGTSYCVALSTRLCVGGAVPEVAGGDSLPGGHKPEEGGDPPLGKSAVCGLLGASGDSAWKWPLMRSVRDFTWCLRRSNC